MSLQYYFCMLEACILNYQMNCCDTVQYTRTLVALLAPLILGKKSKEAASIMQQCCLKIIFVATCLEEA